MSTLNTYFLDPNGDPITGRLPATVVNLSVSRGVELTPAQHTALRHRYLAFCMRRKHEITQFAIEDGHLNDGTRYRITSAHGIDRILAWPMPFNPEDYCPNFLSGIAYKGWIAERTEGSENIQKMLSFYPALAGRPEDTTREWTDLDYFTLPPDVLIMPTREPPLLRLPPAPWDTYSPFASQLAHIKPGLYSGTMRSVVQYMLGTGQQVEFGYLYVFTHGIMKIHDDENGYDVPWVIEISRERGVLASRLFLCKRTDNRYNTLGYTPKGSFLPETDDEKLAEYIEKGYVIQLLSADDLKPAMDRVPFFNECGWAFSYTGNEAQNTCYDAPADSIYLRSYRFKITIEDDGEKPTSAAITLEDEGWMIGWNAVIYSPSQFRVPSYALGGCVTVDMTPDWGQFIQEYDSICPLYVYYKGDEEQIVKWWNEIGIPRPLDEDYPDYDTFDFSNPDHYGVEYMLYSESYAPGKRGKMWQIQSPVHDAVQLDQGSTFTTLKPILDTAWQGYVYMAWSSGGGNEQYLCHGFHEERRVYERDHHQVRDTVTVPMYEREMIYHFRYDITYPEYDYYGVEPYTVFHFDAGKPVYVVGRTWTGYAFSGPYKFRRQPYTNYQIRWGNGGPWYDYNPLPAGFYVDDPNAQAYTRGPFTITLWTYGNEPFGMDTYPTMTDAEALTWASENLQSNLNYTLTRDPNGDPVFTADYDAMQTNGVDYVASVNTLMYGQPSYADDLWAAAPASANYPAITPSQLVTVLAAPSPITAWTDLGFASADFLPTVNGMPNELIPYANVKPVVPRPAVGGETVTITGAVPGMSFPY